MQYHVAKADVGGKYTGLALVLVAKSEWE